MSETREVFVICHEAGYVCRELYDTREAADTELRRWASGGFYHVRRARVTIELLDAPPAPWCFIAPALPPRTTTGTPT